MTMHTKMVAMPAHHKEIMAVSPRHADRLQLEMLLCMNAIEDPQVKGLSSKYLREALVQLALRAPAMFFQSLSGRAPLTAQARDRYELVLYELLLKEAISLSERIYRMLEIGAPLFQDDGLRELVTGHFLLSYGPGSLLEERVGKTLALLTTEEGREKAYSASFYIGWHPALWERLVAMVSARLESESIREEDRMLGVLIDMVFKLPMSEYSTRLPRLSQLLSHPHVPEELRTRAVGSMLIVTTQAGKTREFLAYIQPLQGEMDLLTLAIRVTKWVPFTTAVAQEGNSTYFLIVDSQSRATVEIPLGEIGEGLMDAFRREGIVFQRRQRG